MSLLLSAVHSVCLVYRRSVCTHLYAVLSACLVMQQRGMRSSRSTQLFGLVGPAHLCAVHVSLLPLNCLPCSAARILVLCCWALQGYSALGHCRSTFRLGPAVILCSWALQGYFAVGPWKDTLRLGTAGIPCGWRTAGGWALQGYSLVGHCRGTAVIL